MTVTSARYAAPPLFPGFTQYIIAVIDDVEKNVPDNESNSDRQLILDWEFGPLEDVDGFMIRPTERINTISPYVSPEE